LASIVYLNSGIEGLSPWHWHGQVSAAGLAQIERATAERPDRPMIVFCPHPPEGTVKFPGHPMMGLLNNDEVMMRLAQPPKPVVMFCGHTHLPDVYRRRDLTIVACPSLCFWPHGFLVVELKDGLMHLRLRRLISRVDGSPDPFVKKASYVSER